MYKLLISAGAAALLSACAMTSEPNPTAVAEQQMVEPASAAEIERLNDFTSAMIDAEALYKEAANMPDNDEGVRVYLGELASKRAEQREYLQARVEALGGNADVAGEALGTGHRIFTQIRTAFSDDTEVAIEEVLRGEHYLVDQIGKIMTASPSTDTADLLSTIRTDIQSDIVDLEALDQAV